MGSTCNVNPDVIEGLSSKIFGDAVVQCSSVFIILYFQMSGDVWGRNWEFFSTSLTRQPREYSNSPKPSGDKEFQLLRAMNF